MNPVSVIFLWHFHQPYYKDNFTGRVMMPWARLHATKDYNFMGLLLKDHPSIHATFNYSPSLLAQINDYCDDFDGLIKNEEFLSVSLKKTADLSPEDKILILDGFFQACSSSDNFLDKSPRFRQLYNILKKAGDSVGREERTGIFNSQDYIDAVTLFNLLWIDPISIASDEFLSGLKLKDKKFTEGEKEKLTKEKIPRLIRKIIPAVSELANSGQVEISASPYYHPILPLLCNTDIASFNEKINLPSIPFRNPDDANYQIKSALDYFKKKLNYDIKGMWPSEGSVSENAAGLILNNDIAWIATDEEILANSAGISLSNPSERKLLYRPYAIKRGDKFLYVFFRDKFISDSIGFKYANYPADLAAKDLINNLNNIAVSLQDYNKNNIPAITIALDGENAWEYYKNNGYDFFNYLYEGLSASTLLKTVTFSEHISAIEKSALESGLPDGGNFQGESIGDNFTSEIKFPDIKWNMPSEELDYSKIYNIPNIYPGSWINHNFRIWIGDKEDNKSWDILSKTREYLAGKIADNIKTTKPDVKEGFRVPDLNAAWNQLYISEGSDFNWWYGEDRTSGIDEKYDELYRMQLINVYKFLGEEPPDEYYIPIIEEKKTVKPNMELVSFVFPKIDGIVDDYFEWLGSAVYFPSLLSGKAMAHTGRFIRKLHYGFDDNNFYIRFDFLGEKNEDDLKDKVVLLKFINTIGIEVKLEFILNNVTGLLIVPSIIKGNFNSGLIKAAYKNIIEASMPVSLFSGIGQNNLEFYAVLANKENILAEIERLPVNGYFSTKIPDLNYFLANWLV